MKKSTLILTLAGFICFYISCKPENNTEKTTTPSTNDSTQGELWAEEVESRTILIKPEGWEENYWKTINKGMDGPLIFNTIVDAVLAGKKKAYDLLTDSVLTVEEVKSIIAAGGNANPEEPGVEQKIKPDDLSMIRMREKWHFDKEKFRLEKKVIRIDLTYKKLDETGAYIGDKPLFYVYLD
ncbi:MAG: hypothetical protein WAQ28_09550 [Bacteroidia bacterium]